MYSESRICGEEDHTKGKICLVCLKEIMIGEKVVYNTHNYRYKHTDCVPRNPKKSKPILTEDEKERDIRNAGKCFLLLLREIKEEIEIADDDPDYIDDDWRRPYQSEDTIE